MRKPSLFVLGDSISMHYGPFLKQYLKGVFDYDRKREKGISKQALSKPVGANGGDSSLVLKYLRGQKQKKKLNYDFMLINCGLHDIKTDSITGKKQVPLLEYKNNLSLILKLLKKTGIKLFWVRITPVEDKIHNFRCKSFFRFNRDVNKYNKAADKFMKKYKVSIIDLNTFTRNTGKRLFLDHVHFNKNIRVLQAAFISGFLLKEAGIKYK